MKNDPLFIVSKTTMFFIKYSKTAAKVVCDVTREHNEAACWQRRTSEWLILILLH